MKLARSLLLLLAEDVCQPFDQQVRNDHLTWEGQARGKGITGDTDLAGRERLPETFRSPLPEARLEARLFHRLGPI